MSQISLRVDSMARAAGLGEGYSGHSGRVGLAIRMTRRGTPLQAVQTHGRWKSPSISARYTRSKKALEALEWIVRAKKCLPPVGTIYDKLCIAPSEGTTEDNKTWTRSSRTY